MTLNGTKINSTVLCGGWSLVPADVDFAAAMLAVP